jgi:hypothetical protein
MTSSQNQIASSFPFFDRNFASDYQVQAFDIQSATIDYNDDGIPDQFDLDISFISDQDTTKQCTLMLFFNVSMQDNTNFVTTGMLQYDVQSQSGLSQAKIYSRAKFNQRIPVPRTTLQNVVDMDNIFDANSYDMLESLYSYHRRDYRMMSEYQTIVTSGQHGNKVKLSLTLYLDGQSEVLFESTTLAMLKYAWIQYLVLFVPIWSFFRGILRFTYRYGFFDVRVNNDLPKYGKTY